jgi:peptidoglycan/xylan/chitin deacetylase (PgdA/CDA1 family)
MAACLALITQAALAAPAKPEPVPDKLVVLTFDDSVASHYSVVRPLLKKHGFGATFFITEGFSFPTNNQDYMTWEQIAELHRDGFEIGNHTRDHLGVTERTLGQLREQVESINRRCAEHGIPRPVSFAYPGNAIHPGAVPLLKELGFQFARRGSEPEFPYKAGRGLAFEPGADHPLLIPTAGDARPDWTMADFQRAARQATNGRIAVLQFHGVPDREHPWVHTPPERFAEYMGWLHTNGYRIIALRDLAHYVDPLDAPADPWAVIRQRQATLARGETLHADATLQADAPSSTQAVRDVGWFLRRLRTLEHLPELEDSHTAMSSTWDRSGGNNDGADFKDVRANGCNVLLNVDGPGCIHRIFVGVLTPKQAGTRIQIFLDRRDQPAIDLPLPEFFDDERGPFSYPLVFHKTYPGLLFPIPFARHCRVQLINPKHGTKEWAGEEWSNFWQLTYTRYAAGTPVESLAWPLRKSQRDELEQTCAAWLKAESAAPEEPARWTMDQTDRLEPGGAMRVPLAGIGVIREFRLAVGPSTPEALRGLRFKAYWDGLPAPSVDVPAGYFFGHGDSGSGRTNTAHAAVLGRRAGPDAATYSSHFSSLLLGATPVEAWSRWPMPFSQGARFALENHSSKKLDRVRVRLLVEKPESLPEDWGRFHATWTEERAGTEATPRFGPHDVPCKLALERHARGKYVGTLLHLRWPHEEWWGEGDWLIWTDEDDWPPSYHGTGSEEYFNSGWCRFDRKAISGFVNVRPGDVALYSFHLNDAFQFRRYVRVCEEQWGLGRGEQLIRQTRPLWGSTAFWYARPAQTAGSRVRPLAR